MAAVGEWKFVVLAAELVALLVSGTVLVALDGCLVSWPGALTHGKVGWALAVLFVEGVVGVPRAELGEGVALFTAGV